MIFKRINSEQNLVISICENAPFRSFFRLWNCLRHVSKAFNVCRVSNGNWYTYPPIFCGFCLVISPASSIFWFFGYFLIVKCQFRFKSIVLAMIVKLSLPPDVLLNIWEYLFLSLSNPSLIKYMMFHFIRYFFEQPPIWSSKYSHHHRNEKRH